MSYSGINLENVKSFNRSAILKLLNDQGAMSRKDIAIRLGLAPATVSVICSELPPVWFSLQSGCAFPPRNPNASTNEHH
ncbi:MAG: winged helix-turn-helix domain-containing protein [Clostridiales bacterium]|nr:winged helix-turn-helix domain-containing protein [Clostridiales bacterium]